MSNENTTTQNPLKLTEIRNEEYCNKNNLVFVLKMTLLVIIIIIYVSSIFCFYAFGTLSCKNYLGDFNYTIIDNANYSYIEYISDFIFVPESEEQVIIHINKYLYDKAYYYKKFSLSNYNKNIYCECTKKNYTINITDINLCYLVDCNMKINKNKENNYAIYKWDGNFIYANISRYYINQGINPKSKTCDNQLGYISCGFHENINQESIEICIRNHSMKCPFKAKGRSGNNILFNNIDILFDINNTNDYIINNNISLLDMFPDIKMKDKKNFTFLFNEEINKFFDDNGIGFPIKYKKKNISDKIYIIPKNIKRK